MVTPHGANIGNTAFMLPGTALVEIQPQKCASQNKMHAYEFTSSVVSTRTRMEGREGAAGRGGVRTTSPRPSPSLSIPP